MTPQPVPHRGARERSPDCSISTHSVEGLCVSFVEVPRTASLVEVLEIVARITGPFDEPGQDNKTNPK